MPVRMPHPTPHPKSGIYAARMAIPKHLQEIIARRHGPRVEFRQNLGTRDKAEAVRLSRPIFERFDAFLRAAEAEHRGTSDRLSDHDISVLCGRWLTAREADTREDMVLTRAQHEEAAEHLGDHLRALDDEADFRSGNLIRDMAPEVDPLLISTGRTVDPDSRRRLSERLARVAWEWHRGQVERATTGRVTSPLRPHDFPSEPLKTGAGAGCTMDRLLAGWAADRGWRLDVRPMPRPLYDRLRTMERLATFVGHRDAHRVDREAVARWKAEIQGRGTGASSIRNDFSEMSAVWKHGIAHGLVAENPFAGLSPPKAKKRKREVRPFTRAEAAEILQAARSEHGAIRWLPWVCAFTGARLGEVCQSVKEDVAMVQGVWCLRIHDEGNEGRSLKNEESRRTIPLHPTLIAEGWLAYVDALPASSPLFPDVKPDGLFGSRSVTAGKRIGRWLRETVGVDDERISPSHSWRHYFIDRCREVLMPPEIRSALTGHSGKVDESAGYGDGMRSLVVVMAEHLGRVDVRLD